ncbi:MAG TPA: MnhB domain-containing protein [Thermoleophilaceae bacterium]|nr:MnhB domain-containing protein [Thermoleophilaceae bacterium]
MSPRARLLLFLPSALGLLFLLIDGLQGLPGFGHYGGPYGYVLNGVAVTQRHATNLVSAVNFDYRAFDTLGEEFILFTATTGLILILRLTREESRSSRPAQREDTSEALRGLALAFVAAMIVLGGYVVAHGAITPGGGFQGGVILACSAFLVFLAGEAIAMKRVAPEKLLEFADATGAAGFALIGIGGLVFAGVFFENFLDLGKPGSLNSAGTIPLVSISVGIEVAGAFMLLWTEFVDQALLVRSQGSDGG